jgi:hypothetical protein
LPGSKGEQVAVYDIRVAGQIDAQWSAWLDGLTITHPRPGEAMISGDIVDQAALHGTLNRIRNLNLALISVTRIDPKPVDPHRQTNPSHRFPLPRNRTETRRTGSSCPPPSSFPPPTARPHQLAADTPPDTP